MTDYFCGQGGDNGNDGLSFVNRRLTYASLEGTYGGGWGAGDVVELYGLSSYEFTERFRVYSGTTGNHWTLRIRPGASVRINATTTGGAMGALWGNANSFVTIQAENDGTSGSLELGDEADWAVDNYDGYPAYRQLDFVNCSNFFFLGNGDGTPDGTPSSFIVRGGRHYFGNSFDINCDLFKFIGVDFPGPHGTTDTQDFPTTLGQPGQDNQDWGDYLRIIGTRFYFYLCRWAEGGHNNTEPVGQDLLWQECDFNGYHRATEDPGTISLGMRAYDSSGGNQSNDAYDPWGPQAFEFCTYRNANRAGDQQDNPASKHETGHVISLGCFAWDCRDRFFQCNTITDHGSDGSISRVKILHLTAYKLGSIGSFITTTAAASAYTDMFLYCDLMNCNFDMLQVPVFSRPYFRRFANNEDNDPGIPDGIEDNGWKGLRVRANLVDTESAVAVDCEFRPQSGAFDTFNFEDGDTDYPNVFANNQNTRPSYVGDPDAGDRTTAAFNPTAGGAQVNNADPVGEAASGGTGNTITLKAGHIFCFRDDWGMSYLGVVGQKVYLPNSSGAIRTITSINYGADQMTLDGASLTWSTDDPIYHVLPDGTTPMLASGSPQIGTDWQATGTPSLPALTAAGTAAAGPGPLTPSPVKPRRLPPYLGPVFDSAFQRWLSELRIYVDTLPGFSSGDGTPEGAVYGSAGDRYFNTTGSPGTRLYVKTTDSGTTGWLAYG